MFGGKIGAGFGEIEEAGGGVFGLPRDDGVQPIVGEYVDWSDK